MQIDLASVIATVSGIVSVAFALYVALAKYAVAQREKEIDRRLEHCAEEQKHLADRIGNEEKATIRQDGALNLVKQTHDDVLHDIEEIKRLMVTKAEWEPRMTNIERTMNQILSELRGSRYSSQHMPSVTPKKPGT